MLPANDRLRCGPTLAFAAATLVLAFASLAPRFPQTGADELEIEFIGNMAFRLGDGATTLYSDFPYRSGAFGYMTYDLPLAGLGDGASLITHEHADHWDAQLFAQTRLELIAHPSIAARVPSERVLSWDERISYGGIEIEPIATEHTPSHRSYLVHWRGLRLYFTGDTESTAELLAQHDLDVAFVSPWLVRALAEEGREVGTELLVIYHHTEGEAVPEIQRQVQPSQGQRLRVAFP